MRRFLLAAAVFVAVLAPGAPAWAHAQLVSADPAQNAVLTTGPAAVELTFNEDLNPEFTTIVVSTVETEDAARQRIAATAPTVDGPAGTLTLGSPLTDGAYTVAYRVVSADGHTVQGSYGFTVGEPKQPAVAAPPTEPGGLPTSVLIGLGALCLALAGAAGYLSTAVRRRRQGVDAPESPARPSS